MRRSTMARAPATPTLTLGIDEVRLETVPRSPAWLAVQVASMRRQLVTFP